jgi:Phage tail assembly chaperone protein, TAC
MHAAFVGEFIHTAMGSACGVLGWSPDAFWQATPFDLLYAWNGFETFHGLTHSDDLTEHDVRDLRSLLNEKKHGV